MTLYFTNAQIQIYRNRKIGTSDRYSMSATFTVYNADIQPAGQERTEFIGGHFGATFTAFVDTDADIKENDQIVNIDTNKRYSVRAVSDWSGAGMLDHKELILTSRDG